MNADWKEQDVRIQGWGGWNGRHPPHPCILTSRFPAPYPPQSSHARISLSPSFASPRRVSFLSAFICVYLRFPFPLQQRALAVDTPPVAAEVAVAADDAVAGDRHGQRVGGAGAAYRAHGLGTADARCHLHVGRR